MEGRLRQALLRAEEVGKALADPLVARDPSKLKALGLYDGVVDGRIGPVTQAAYAKFQASRGEVADGFITHKSFEALSGVK